MNTLFIKVVAFFLISATIWSQKKQKSFEFKKGEILDVILLSTNENTSKLFDRYKQTAFPVAFEYTYQPQPGFSIKELTLGNHLPSSLIIGKWNSKEKREGFLKNIVKKVPDFHEQRRSIFKYFGLTYYTMEKDINFSVNTERFNMVSAFWGKEKNAAEFYKNWEKKIKISGGEITIKLKKGISPTGYYYNPDVFYIISWKNKELFDAFARENPLSYYEDLKNVHQFVIK
jgi:hypothetical protein